MTSHHMTRRDAIEVNVAAIHKSGAVYNAHELHTLIAKNHNGSAPGNPPTTTAHTHQATLECKSQTEGAQKSQGDHGTHTPRPAIPGTRNATSQSTTRGVMRMRRPRPTATATAPRRGLSRHGAGDVGWGSCGQSLRMFNSLRGLLSNQVVP